MIIGKLDSVRTIAEIFSHLSSPNVQGNALILMFMINRSFRSAVISNFKLILSIIVKGEPIVDTKSLDNPNIESETTIMKDLAKRGLTWIVKESKGDDVFIGSNFRMSFKLEKIVVGDNSEIDITKQYQIRTFCNSNSKCAIFKDDQNLGTDFIYIG